MYKSWDWEYDTQVESDAIFFIYEFYEIWILNINYLSKQLHLFLSENTLIILILNL